MLDEIRKSFRQASSNDAAAVIRTIQLWQHVLWHFSSVGDIGKRNGPTGWQQPWTPLGASHELRLNLSTPTDGTEVALYLVASDAGDGHQHDLTRWKNARLVAKDRKDLYLRDIPGALPIHLDVTAPSVLEVKIPAGLAKNAEFVVTASLLPHSDLEASVQVQVLSAKPNRLTGRTVGETLNSTAESLWSDNNARTNSSAPILMRDGSSARQRLETAFAEFRALFPVALFLPENCRRGRPYAVLSRGRSVKTFDAG